MTFATRTWEMLWTLQAGRDVKNGTNENVAPRFITNKECWFKPNPRTFAVRVALLYHYDTVIVPLRVPDR